MGLAEIDKDLGLDKVNADLAQPPSMIEWLRGQYQKGQAAKSGPMGEPASLRGFTGSAPSLPSALSILTPGAGLGSSLFRTGLVGAAQGGESLLSGEGDPRRQAVKGAAAQAATEALPYVAAPLLRGAMRYTPGLAGPTAIREGFKDIANRMSPAPPTAVPGENMVRFAPGSGTPPSTILGPSGQPAIPAIPPQKIMHPNLRGWEGADILNPVTHPNVGKVAGNPDYMGIPRAMARGGGAVGQEAIAQQGMPAMDPVRLLIRVLGLNQ